MNFTTIETINEEIKNTPGKFIEYAEENYYKQINSVAKDILKSNKHILLLSGPSGSGKTTTALRIEGILEEAGIETHTISMDNYFLSNDKIVDVPLNADGTPDLESPYRLDIPLFKDHLQKLNTREEIAVPYFDFGTGTVTKYTPLKRKENEIIIIEGIHALNPLVTGSDAQIALRLYVSVRTRLKYGELILHPRKIRLMRRLCRDYQFRGRKLNQIVDMFKAVSKGENLYITPFKKHADFEVDTFLPYEVSLYGNYIINALAEQSDEVFESRQTYLELKPFLTAVDNIPIDLVPQTSLVREFIGGSLFEY
ncbi:hypothetical protein FACS1894132_11030 [Clostridia bacterium]|nr:hypothetical protein FACS1894132_11030 [Clostridia bacterium]